MLPVYVNSAAGILFVDPAPASSQFPNFEIVVSGDSIVVGDARLEYPSMGQFGIAIEAGVPLDFRTALLGEVRTKLLGLVPSNREEGRSLMRSVVNEFIHNAVVTRALYRVPLTTIWAYQQVK